MRACVCVCLGAGGAVTWVGLCVVQGSGLEDLLICADDGNDVVYPKVGDIR